MSLLFPISRLGRTNAKRHNSDLFNLFDDILEGTSTAYDPTQIRNTPRTNIVKRDNVYTIEMAAPGYSRDEFEMTVDDGRLTIALGTEDTKEYNDAVIHREYTFSSFKRSFSLPEGTNIEGINARYEAGILYVNVPVEDKNVQKRKITVE